LAVGADAGRPASADVLCRVGGARHRRWSAGRRSGSVARPRKPSDHPRTQPRDGPRKPVRTGTRKTPSGKARRCCGGNARHHEGPRKPLAPPGAPFPSGKTEKGTGGAHAEVKQQGGGALARRRHSGAPQSGEPGIHKRRTGEWSKKRATARGSWLWIPGPALTRRPGMTARLSSAHPALFSSTFAAYITPAVPQGPAMAINGRRNKPIGPGGSTRRLHPCSSLARLPFQVAGSVRPTGRTGELHRRGRNRIDEGVKDVLLPEMVPT